MLPCNQVCICFFLCLCAHFLIRTFRWKSTAFLHTPKDTFSSTHELVYGIYVHIHMYIYVRYRIVTTSCMTNRQTIKQIAGSWRTVPQWQSKDSAMHTYKRSWKTLLVCIEILPAAEQSDLAWPLNFVWLGDQKISNASLFSFATFHSIFQKKATNFLTSMPSQVCERVCRCTWSI